MEARELPGGTVTLLFTDIEGSTRLLQELGRETYVRALTAHRRLLREAFTAHGGVEIEMQGDSFHFAFPYARDAVAAAVAGQRAMHEHEWESQPITVRIGLHTGEPIQADGLYAGLDVHRAARVMSAGHGGQVLVSQQTAELVDGELPEEISLLDLGEHRLKDLSAPQRLYQALANGLPAEFAPLQTLHQTNLPVPATPLLGREVELAEMTALLAREEVRLLTLTGPGGTGKTRLALQAAAEEAEAFPDGVWWVPLAPLRDPALILATIAQALGVRAQPGRPLGETLRETLAGKRALVLLDNAEHLLPAFAVELAPLREVAGPLLLVTSRERLQLQGEHVYSVPTLSEEDGIELFLARAAQYGSTLDRSPAVASLCARLDELPLALELAAARTVLFSPEQLLERLSRRLDLLKGGRDADPRQQTLRATIEWSHELLDEDEKRLFRRLSVFVGGCTLEAAEEVCDADLDTLQSLLDKSLLRRREDDTRRRFWMLETIQEYARERLERSSDSDHTRAAHAAWFSELAAKAELRGPEHATWLKRLRGEHANFREALASLQEQGRTVEQVRLASDLGEYAYHSGALVEGRRWLADAVARSAECPDHLRARALAFSAMTAGFQGDLPEAVRSGEEALALARKVDEPAVLGEALRALAGVRDFQGDEASAERLNVEALDLAREYQLEVLLADVANNLGYLALESGDLPRAESLLTEGIAVGSARNDAIVVSIGLVNLGMVAFKRSSFDDAARYLADALSIARRHSFAPASWCSLVGIGALMAQAGDYEQSARVYGGVEELVRRTGETLQRVERELREQALSAIVEALGDHATSAAMAGGRTAGPDEVAAGALEWLEQRR